MMWRMPIHYLRAVSRLGPTQRHLLQSHQVIYNFKSQKQSKKTHHQRDWEWCSSADWWVSSGALVSYLLWKSSDHVLAEKSKPNKRDVADAEFHDLAQKSGVKLVDVYLGNGSNGRGLFACEDIEEGDLIIRVPMDVCLLNVNDPEDELYDKGIGWPFWMTLNLMRSSDVKVSTIPVWVDYAKRFLPSMQETSASIPTGMPIEKLKRHSDIQGMHQVEELRETLDNACTKLTGKAASERMVWAFANVISRSFGLDSTNSKVALVPFVDMLNHNQNYSAKLRQDTQTDSVFVYATKDIPKGTEIMIPYCDEVPNSVLFCKYGFVDSSCTENRLPIGSKPLSQPRFKNFLEQQVSNEDGVDACTYCVIESLTFNNADLPLNEELESIQTLLSSIKTLADTVEKHKSLDSESFGCYYKEYEKLILRANDILSAYSSFLQS